MSRREMKKFAKNAIVGSGEGALVGLAFANPAVGLAIGAGVGASGVGKKLKLPFFTGGRSHGSAQEQTSVDLSAGEQRDEFGRVIRNTAVGALQGAVVGSLFGNARAGAAYGAALGGLGVGTKLGLPFFTGGARKKSKRGKLSRQLAQVGRGNVFGEIRRTRLMAARSRRRSRSKSRSRSRSRSASKSRSRSRSRSKSKSLSKRSIPNLAVLPRSRSHSRSRSRSRSRSPSPTGRMLRSATKMNRLRSRSTSPLMQTTEEKERQMKMILDAETKRDEFYRANPHKISPNYYKAQNLMKSLY